MKMYSIRWAEIDVTMFPAEILLVMAYVNLAVPNSRILENSKFTDFD